MMSPWLLLRKLYLHSFSIRVVRVGFISTQLREWDYHSGSSQSHAYPIPVDHSNRPRDGYTTKVDGTQSGVSARETEETKVFLSLWRCWEIRHGHASILLPCSQRLQRNRATRKKFRAKKDACDIIWVPETSCAWSHPLFLLKPVWWILFTSDWKIPDLYKPTEISFGLWIVSVKSPKSLLGSKITADGDCSHEIKAAYSLEEKLWPT